MAYVSHPTEDDIADSKKFGAAPPSVWFLPGWAPDLARVWSFSRYARKRLQSGRSVKLRRYPIYHTGPLRNTLLDDPYDPLPVEAKCASCGFRNLLTFEELGISYLIVKPAFER